MNIKPTNDRVSSIIIEGNSINYSTPNGTGFFNIMDASGEYAAENVAEYIEHVLSLGSDLQSCATNTMISEKMLVESIFLSEDVGFEIGLFSFNSVV